MHRHLPNLSKTEPRTKQCLDLLTRWVALTLSCLHGRYNLPVVHLFTDIQSIPLTQILCVCLIFCRFCQCQNNTIASWWSLPPARLRIFDCHRESAANWKSSIADVTTEHLRTGEKQKFYISTHKHTSPQLQLKPSFQNEGDKPYACSSMVITWVCSVWTSRRTDIMYMHMLIT